MPTDEPIETGLRPLDPGAAELEVFGARDRETVIIEGALAVQRLLEAGYRPSVVVATSSHAKRISAAWPGVALRVASHQALRGLAGFDFHRGVLAALGRSALAAGPEKHRLAGLEGPCTVVILVGLADPANVGTIIRSARALGVDLVVCDRKGADPWGRKAIRASAGHCFGQHLWVDAEIPQVFKALALHSIRTVAFTPSPSATALSRLRCPAKVAFVFGNEGEGLGPEALSAADFNVAVDMVPGVDSLNVAGCAAIALWHRFVAQAGSGSGNETASSTNS